MVLFGGEKIGVCERPAFLIAPRIHGARIFSAPHFDVVLLFGKSGSGSTLSRHKRRFEVIGKGKDQMDPATWHGARHNHSSGVSFFARPSHSISRFSHKKPRTSARTSA
jgi:hypothetical protein